MSFLLKASSLVNNGIDILDSIVGIKSLSGIKMLLGGKPKSTETGEQISKKEGEEKPQIRTGVADIGRNDEIIKSSLLFKLSPKRRAAFHVFDKWVAKKKGILKARILRKHFNEEFEINPQTAIRKLEDVIEIFIKDGALIAFQYCESMEYTKDSSIEFLKTIKDKGLKALGDLDGTVGKRLNRNATATLKKQRKLLEIEEQIRKKWRK